MAEYIDRERLKQVFWGACKNCLSEDDIADLIDEMPAADVAPVVHGKFIELNIDDEMKPSEFQCSVCGHTEELFMITPEELEWKYCPHCGAKMDGEAE